MVSPGEPSGTRFDELAVLVAVGEAGSLAAAAVRLGVPKSTVGRAIRRLEEELDVALVRRAARGPALTEPGRLLVGLSAPHVAALRDATKAVGRQASEPSGLLRVTAASDIGALVLGPLLPGFLARYPRVRVEIEHTHRVVDIVSEGFDLAVRVAMTPLPSSTLMAKRLAPLKLALYSSTTYAARRELPRHPNDLERCDYVGIRPGATETLMLEGPRSRVKVTLKARASGNDLFFVREAVAAGAGIGALPWFLASPELAAGRITRILPEYRVAGGTAYIVVPPTKPVAAKLAAFKDYLVEHAPRLMVGPG